MRKMGPMIGVALVGLLISVGMVDAAEWKLGVRVDPVALGQHRILEVFDGSPAKACGLKVGQTIVAIDGKLVGDPQAVKQQIGASKSIALIYQDGPDFWEVTADLQGDNSNIYGAKVKSVSKPKKVGDPRKKKK